MLQVEKIFVPLPHGSKHTRHIGLSAVTRRQRLAGGIVREKRGQFEHICERPLLEGRGDRCREEVPRIRFTPTSHMAALGLVAMPNIHFGSHSKVPRRRDDYESGSSLGRCWGTSDIHARKKTIDTLLETNLSIIYPSFAAMPSKRSINLILSITNKFSKKRNGCLCIVL